MREDPREDAEAFARGNTPQTLCENYKNNRLWSMEEALTPAERDAHAIRASVYATHLRKHWREDDPTKVQMHVCSRCAGIEGAPTPSVA